MAFTKEGDFTGAFGYTIGTVLKRPFVLVYFGLIAFAYAVLDMYFPVFEILFRLGTFNGSDIFSSVIYFLQLSLKLLMTPKGIMLFIGLLLGASILSGALFSGYFYMVGNTIERKQKAKKEIIGGLRRYFKRISVITFFVLLFSIVFIVVCLIASVPAFVVTKAAFGDKQELMVPALLVDFVTIMALFFGIMFFRIYISFWYPAAISCGKKVILTAKRRADACFWTALKSFMLFDLIFVVFQVMFVNADKYMGKDIVLFVGKWIFNTFFYSFLIIYIFSLYNTKSGVKD